jgi:hypothetical protein
MRLIKVASDPIEVVEFSGNVPQYAILSHTWGPDEVLLEDVKTQKGTLKAGYEKITYSCSQAKRDPLDISGSIRMDSLFDTGTRGRLCWQLLAASGIPHSALRLLANSRTLRCSHY